MRTIRAKFINGIIEPLERLELPEGSEVFITILEMPSSGREVTLPFLDSAGGWIGLIDGEKFKRDIYKDRMVSTRKEPKI